MLGLLLGLALLLAPPAHAYPQIVVALRAWPSTYYGPLPTMVVFYADITASEACTVTYRFIRSDGITTGPAQQTFPAAGKQTVSHQWENLTSSCSGWVRFEVSSPSLVTKQVNFAVHEAPIPTFKLSLYAMPTVYTGPLPTTIRFVGSIMVTGPCTFSYGFVRSSGEEQWYQDTFDTGQTMIVSDSWTVSAQEREKERYWEKLCVRWGPGPGIESGREWVTIWKASEQPITATLYADPPEGKFLPYRTATITFRGTIYSKRAGEVRYAFVRSDGWRSNGSVNFKSPGSKDVSLQWTFKEEIFGWMVLRVLSPVLAESNHTDFKVYQIGD